MTEPEYVGKIPEGVIINVSPPENKQDTNGNCLHTSKGWLNIDVDRKSWEIHYMRCCQTCGKILNEKNNVMTQSDFQELLDNTEATVMQKKRMQLNFLENQNNEA